MGYILQKALNNALICRAIEAFPWLHTRINKLLINSLVNKARTRPHPHTTVSNYTSWKSLTDYTWSARHLPEKELPNNAPSEDDLIKLFRRPEGQEPRLCPKSTCLFPAFAQYLTDGFIRTKSDKTDPDYAKRNTSNHNIDLCTLYGLNEEHTDALRLRSNKPGERGQLKYQIIDGEEFPHFLYRNGNIDPQFACLDEPLGLPELLAGCNSQDQNIKKQAEQKRDSLFAVGGDRVNSVPQTSMINTLLLREHNRLARQLEKNNNGWDDDRVFETARNIVIVEFIKVVIEDYINHISQIRFNLLADPSVAWAAKWNRPNWITTEFSLLYRWHGLVPDVIQWDRPNPYPIHETFMNNTPLIGIGLAEAFKKMSAQPACELGPLNTTSALLEVEKDSIKQGRICKLASYTDYREYLGLKSPKTMDDVSSNPEVRRLLKEFYGKDPSKIDFYVGLFVEDRSRNSPLGQLVGSFVALDAFSQAMTNPLLSEHVFNEHTFTSYGFQEIKNTSSLKDILFRNVKNIDKEAFISMTRKGWKKE